MKVLQKYLILGLLMFSLRIDSSDDDQLGSVDPELTEKLNKAVETNDIFKVTQAVAAQSIGRKQINSVGKDGLGALHIAAKNNNGMIMQFLLEFGADPNLHIVSDPLEARREADVMLIGATPLLIIAQGFSRNPDMNKQCFDLLLKKGADITETGWTGYTLLHVLADSYNQNWRTFMKAAIDAGVDVNAKTHDYKDKEKDISFYSPGYTALHLLARSKKLDRLEIAKEFINNGADCQIIDQLGRTPLMLVSSTSLDEMPLKKLLRTGKADIGIVDSFDENNKINFVDPQLIGKLIEAIKFNKIDMVKKLLQGIDKNQLNDLDKNGQALWTAIFTNRSNMVKFLLDAGIDPNVSNRFGERIFYEAVDLDFVRMVRLLLEAGADPNRLDENESVLNKAVEKGSLEMALLLLDYGANVNGMDRLGFTPLHKAVMVNDFNMMSFLLERGADPNMQDKTGRTPFDYISPKNPDKIALKKLLERYSIDDDKIEKKIEKNDNTVGILKKVNQDKKQNQRVQFDYNAQYDDGDASILGGDKERIGLYERKKMKR